MARAGYGKTIHDLEGGGGGAPSATAWAGHRPSSGPRLQDQGSACPSFASRAPSEWEVIRQGLLAYKSVFGDVLVPRDFVVPDHDPDWAEDLWGLQLGAIVRRIRCGQYREHRAEMEAMGFAFRAAPRQWEDLRLGLGTYKAQFGGLRVPSRFTVPRAPPWPEALWGWRLGGVVASIRRNKLRGTSYAGPGHLHELDAMGFDWDAGANVQTGALVLQGRPGRGAAALCGTDPLGWLGGTVQRGGGGRWATPPNRRLNSADLADLFRRFVGFLNFADLFCRFFGFL